MVRIRVPFFCSSLFLLGNPPPKKCKRATESPSKKWPKSETKTRKVRPSHGSEPTAQPPSRPEKIKNKNAKPARGKCSSTSEDSGRALNPTRLAVAAWLKDWMPPVSWMRSEGRVSRNQHPAATGARGSSLFLTGCFRFLVWFCSKHGLMSVVIKTRY